MKKILYLTPGCFDKGGISRYNRYQITALRDLFGRDAVNVFSVLGPDADSFEAPFETEWSANGLSAPRKAMYVARAILNGLRTRPDYIFAAHVNLASLAVVIARLTGAVSVLNVYGLEVWSGFRKDAEWGLRSADRIISDCHFTARYLVQSGLRDGNTTDVIWDCVDPVRFSPGRPRESVIRKYGIPSPDTGVNLLTLGRMTRDSLHKGYERLLQVFAKVASDVPDLRLVYAGRGGLTDELRRQAAANGVGERVFFLGAIHEDDLADVYRSAHMFSLVSDRGVGRGEGLPLTPLEAAACGMPIFVGNQDGSQEAVINGENGFVHDPFDLDAQARSIALLARDIDKRARMGVKARARIEAQFSYEAFRARLERRMMTWTRPERQHQELPAK